MSRKSSGLRNRFRNGRGTYSRLGKGKVADRYGSYDGGKQKAPEVIGKHVRAVDAQDEAQEAA